MALGYLLGLVLLGLVMLGLVMLGGLVYKSYKGRKDYSDMLEVCQ